ncbi:MAG TPA: hypothetical protein VIR15_19895, partial [Intrasporangium sp.]|uniref:hypothetical protein n=1 Tax=Intrasporangium sp. TaxID=1925024 RepID=UPI002FA8D174
IELDPSVVTAEYRAAARAARDAVHGATPPAWLDEQHDRWLREGADLAPGELVHTGSGWGRAELALRGATAQLPGTPFPEVGDESLPLLRLVELDDPTALDRMDPQRPALPLVSDRWAARLSDAVERGAGWWAYYALGTTRHLRGDLDGAQAAYRRSAELHPTAVTLRGEALLAADAMERDALYRRACSLAPDDRRLAVERLISLRDAGRPGDIVAAVAALPVAVRDHGRTQMLLAEALSALGQDVAALEVLKGLEVPDLAEGDRTLSDLWQRLRPGEPVPRHLDFRMSPGPAATEV